MANKRVSILQCKALSATWHTVSSALTGDYISLTLFFSRLKVHRSVHHLHKQSAGSYQSFPWKHNDVNSWRGNKYAARKRIHLLSHLYMRKGWNVHFTCSPLPPPTQKTEGSIHTRTNISHRFMTLRCRFVLVHALQGSTRAPVLLQKWVSTNYRRYETLPCFHSACTCVCVCIFACIV